MLWRFGCVLHQNRLKYNVKLCKTKMTMSFGELVGLSSIVVLLLLSGVKKSESGRHTLV